MRSVGIICEYNPFHLGHARQFTILRERGYDRIVCLMSGNFVQRAEAAVLPKYERAECALRAGADLVLELPFPYAASVSEVFAAGALSILHRIGVETLSFGSESADPERLLRASEILSSEIFAAAFSTMRQSHPEFGSAVLSERAFYACGGTDFPSSPNDLLGIAYLRAARMMGIHLHHEIIERDGIGYSETSLIPGQLPSAKGIRASLLAGDLQTAERFVPDTSPEIWGKAAESGVFPVHPLKPFSHLLPRFRTMNPNQLVDVAEVSGGLGERLCSTARQAVDADDWLARAATKKYTASHLRRSVLFAGLGVKREDLDSLPTYTLLLGANATGRAWLSELRKNVPDYIITKPADAPECRQTELWRLADALYTLSLPVPRPAGYFFSASPVIL